MKELNFLNLLLSPFKEAPKKAQTAKPTTEILEISGVRILVARNPRQKVLRIAIKPGELPKLSGKISTTRQEFETFVQTHWDWLLKSIEKMQKIEDSRPRKEMKESEVFLFLGIEKKFVVRVTPLKKAFFSSDEAHLHLNLPEAAFKFKDDVEKWSHYKKELQKYYQREAIKHIRSRVDALSHKTGLIPNKVAFRAQNTRWGSCSSKGHLSLNWKIIVAPASVIDYVLIHELCHLKHLNHSESFWNLVSKWDPDYQQSETWLKNKGHQAEFLANS